ARFDDDSVLAWFRRHWDHLKHAEEADDRLEKLLGISVYGLDSLFRRAAEHDLPAPSSEAKLREYLEEYLYVEGDVYPRPHLIQVLTDDDAVGLAYYFFDGHFLAKHGPRAAYLLTEGWQLPGGAGEGPFTPAIKTQPLRPAGRGEGATYLVTLVIYSTDYLECLDDSYRIQGLRLPELARHLARPGSPEKWPFELQLARSQLLASPAGASAQEE